MLRGRQSKDMETCSNSPTWEARSRHWVSCYTAVVTLCITLWPLFKLRLLRLCTHCAHERHGTSEMSMEGIYPVQGCAQVQLLQRLRRLQT